VPTARAGGSRIESGRFMVERLDTLAERTEGNKTAERRTESSKIKGTFTPSVSLGSKAERGKLMSARRERSSEEPRASFGIGLGTGGCSASCAGSIGSVVLGRIVGVSSGSTTLAASEDGASMLVSWSIDSTRFESSSDAVASSSPSGDSSEETGAGGGVLEWPRVRTFCADANGEELLG